MKILPLVLIAGLFMLGDYKYEGSTTSAVVLAGGIIKSTHIEPSDQKYKRKNCPVCKGTGKYLSGDGIKMVDCGYCEPDKKQAQTPDQYQIIERVIEHPPVILHSVPKCYGPNCKVKKQ